MGATGGYVDPTDALVFGAVGDVAFHGAIGETMLREGVDWPFDRVRELLGRADVVFGNMEPVVLPPDYPREQKDPQGLISPLAGDQAALALKHAGFDFMNMAANHVLDAGTEGMFYTQQCLRDVGLSTGGIGYTQEEARRLQVLERGGIRLGFLCYCEDNNYSLSTTGPCHAYYEVESVLEDVRASRDQVDVLIVSIHADIEFMETPSVPRRDAARQIARAGADIILQHHPHLPQGIEVVDGCLIAYSLGNFVFNSHTSPYMASHGPHTAHSFLLLVHVGKDGVRLFERVSIVIGKPPEERPCPAAGDRARMLTAYLSFLDGAVRDDTTVHENWRKTAREFVRRYAQALGESPQPEQAIYDTISRLLFVAENRRVMNEVVRMAQER